VEGGAAFAGGFGVGILVGVFGLEALAAGVGTQFLAVNLAFAGYQVGKDLQGGNYDLAAFDTVLTLLGIGAASAFSSDAPTPSVTIISPAAEETGPIFTHFTNAEGAAGITGYPVENLQVGQSVEVNALRFGSGQNPFMSNNPGDNFVTTLGPGASPGQLGRIGVTPDKQAFAIEFDARSAFTQGIRPVQTGQGISTIPANATLRGQIYAYENKMTREQIEEYLEDLRSADYERQTLGLDGLAKLVREISAIAIQTFSDSESEAGDWVLVDRLVLLATQVKLTLREFISATQDERKRRLAAIALIELGDTDVVPILLDAVELDKEFCSVAANKLANKKIAEVIPAIYKRLTIISPVEHPLVPGLLMALRKLTDSLPEHIYRRLHDGMPHPEVYAALRDFKIS